MCGTTEGHRDTRRLAGWLARDLHELSLAAWVENWKDLLTVYEDTNVIIFCLFRFQMMKQLASSYLTYYCSVTDWEL